MGPPLVQRGEPSIHVLAGLVLGDAVALLNLALELIALAVDGREVVVGEVAPLLLDLARELFQLPAI